MKFTYVVLLLLATTSAINLRAFDDAKPAEPAAKEAKKGDAPAAKEGKKAAAGKDDGEDLPNMGKS